MPFKPAWSSKLIAADAGGIGLCASLPAPEEEARALLKLLENGEDAESVRALIAVPRKIETVLRRYAELYATERKGVERVLHFCQRVAEEFDRLVAGNGAATNGKIEESSQEAL